MAGPFVGACGLFADLGIRDYEQTGERRRVLRIFGEQSYGPLSESEMRAGLESLTLIERLLCRRLIVRQLRVSPRVGRDLRDFGPTGLIKLYSARALQLFVFVLVVVAVALSFAQVTPPCTHRYLDPHPRSRRVRPNSSLHRGPRGQALPTTPIGRRPTAGVARRGRDRLPLDPGRFALRCPHDGQPPNT
jgi:hypothetical protein